MYLFSGSKENLAVLLDCSDNLQLQRNVRELFWIIFESKEEIINFQSHSFSVCHVKLWGMISEAANSLCVIQLEGGELQLQI